MSRTRPFSVQSMRREDLHSSFGSLHVESGRGMTLWADGNSAIPRSAADISLELQPHQQVVIGRQEGGEVPYLDPQFRPTRMASDTGQCVLKHDGHGRDRYVSRGHFILRASAHGILLINGVPRRGGGIRPPLTGRFWSLPLIARWTQAKNS